LIKYDSKEISKKLMFERQAFFSYYYASSFQLNAYFIGLIRVTALRSINVLCPNFSPCSWSANKSGDILTHPAVAGMGYNYVTLSEFHLMPDL